jgi:hypothetical protein
MNEHTFTSHRVQEIHSAKSTSDARVDLMTDALDTRTRAATNVRENIAFPEFDQSQLSVVAVGEEVYSNYISTACPTVKLSSERQDYLTFTSM